MKKSRGRQKGYKMSDAAKKLCKQSHVGRTNYYTRKVVVSGVVYDSVTAAAEAFNIGKGTVVYRIKNIYNNTEFKSWSYL